MADDCVYVSQTLVFHLFLWEITMHTNCLICALYRRADDCVWYLALVVIWIALMYFGGQ